MLKGHDDMVQKLVCSPDGTRLLSASALGQICLWDLQEGTCEKTMPLPGGIVSLSIAFTRDNVPLAALKENHCVTVLNVLTGERAPSMDLHCLATPVFSPDGSLLVMCCREGVMHVRGTQSAFRDVIASPRGANANDRCTVSNSNGLLAMGARHCIYICDLPEHREMTLFAEGTGEVRVIAFAPDDDVLAAVINTTTVILWDVKTRAILHRLPSRDWIMGIAFSQTGRFLLTPSISDGVFVNIVIRAGPAPTTKNATLRMWDTRIGEIKCEIAVRPTFVAIISKDDSEIISGETAGDIIIHPSNIRIPRVIDPDVEFDGIKSGARPPTPQTS